MRDTSAQTFAALAHRFGPQSTAVHGAFSRWMRCGGRTRAARPPQARCRRRSRRERPARPVRSSRAPGAADLLHLVERDDVRRQLRELGPVRQLREELRPALGRRGLERERVGDADVDGLAGRRRDRAATEGHGRLREPARAERRARVRSERGRRALPAAPARTLDRRRPPQRDEQQRSRQENGEAPRRAGSPPGPYSRASMKAA